MRVGVYNYVLALLKIDGSIEFMAIPLNFVLERACGVNTSKPEWETKFHIFI